MEIHQYSNEKTVEISIKYMEILMKNKWKSIGNPFKISMKNQSKFIGNPE